MSSKWKSRKFWVAIIGAIFSLIATLGYDVPVSEVLVIDALLAVWILAEASVDAAKKK